MLIDELMIYLFDGQVHLLAEPMATWLASSRRFTAFVTTFRAKIRKKLRLTQEQENLLDLRLELETAYLLLQERSLSLEYEPQGGRQARCPDFAVTFTTSVVFMVEVTRLRSAQNRTVPRPQGHTLALLAPSRTLQNERLADTICSKLGQLLPQHANVLLVGVESPGITHNDLRAIMHTIQQGAERNDTAIVQRHHFRDRPDFFQHYQRLSELLVRGPQIQAGEPVSVWVNPQAKYPLPSKVRTALYHSHSV